MWKSISKAIESENKVVKDKQQQSVRGEVKTEVNCMQWGRK